MCANNSTSGVNIRTTLSHAFVVETFHKISGQRKQREECEYRWNHSIDMCIVSIFATCKQYPIRRGKAYAYAFDSVETCNLCVMSIRVYFCEQIRSGNMLWCAFNQSHCHFYCPCVCVCVWLCIVWRRKFCSLSHFSQSSRCHSVSGGLHTIWDGVFPFSMPHFPKIFTKRYRSHVTYSSCLHGICQLSCLRSEINWTLKSPYAIFFFEIMYQPQ